MREILFVAGESSGDAHAAGVARELIAARAPYKLVGIGGDQMQAAGVDLIEHTRRLAVMGFVEVLETIPRHWALLQTLKRRLREGNVAAVEALVRTGTSDPSRAPYLPAAWKLAAGKNGTDIDQVIDTVWPR